MRQFAGCYPFGFATNLNLCALNLNLNLSDLLGFFVAFSTSTTVIEPVLFYFELEAVIRLSSLIY